MNDDRLAKVQPRQTYIIKLWFIKGQYEDWMEDSRCHIIGPFTRTECERIEATLTWAHKCEQITIDMPDWAVLP